MIQGLVAADSQQILERWPDSVAIIAAILRARVERAGRAVPPAVPALPPARPRQRPRPVR
ncbi:hypothetical protein ACFY8P_26840 [Streptomyces sp. NPDC012693]|uniref:hypothetical protein n=1 Tax=Streptomyces sp. NPDC012693 TaxID=3364844 RepID=UPI0036C9743B